MGCFFDATEEQKRSGVEGRHNQLIRSFTLMFGIFLQGGLFSIKDVGEWVMYKSSVPDLMKFLSMTRESLFNLTEIIQFWKM